MSGLFDLIKHKSSFENLDEKEKIKAQQLSRYFTAIKHSVNMLMDCVVVSIAVTFLFAFALPNYIIFVFAGVWFLFRLQAYFRNLQSIRTGVVN